MAQQRWTNWSGRVECTPAQLLAPSSIEEVVRIVREAAEAGRTVRVVGSGHSFTDLVKTSGVLMTLDNLSGLVEVDTKPREAVVLGGTKLHVLNDLLDRYGLAMENLGDIDRQTIAGALSTGTHGTGVSMGCLPTQVIGLTLVTATGEVMECSEEKYPKVFRAALVSLGALGVIVQVKLRLVPAFRMTYVRRRADFTETIEKAQLYARDNRHFEFFHFPHTESVLLKFHNATEDPIRSRRYMRWFNENLSENFLFERMSRTCRKDPAQCPRISQRIARFAPQGYEVNKSYKVLVTRRTVRFNEMEYALPYEHGPAAMREIKEWIAEEGIPVHFPIEYRYVRGDQIWLSPFYERHSVTISLHMYQGMEYERFFNGAEAIFRKYAGRPHWGKLHSLSRTELESLYPNWEAFQALRHRVDPNHVFLNRYLKTLFVTG